MDVTEQQKVLDKAIGEVWDALKKTVFEYAERDKRIGLDDDFDKFRKGFLNRYKQIMENYMRDDVRELDRHKIVAIMIVVCIEDGIIKYEEEVRSLVNLAPYTISVEVGLNWMLKGLNRELEKAKPGCVVQSYYMPEAFTCPTRYFEIFCRNLYYAKKDWKGLNPLDIAERLYLLEYITLQYESIPPSVLKTYGKRAK